MSRLTPILITVLSGCLLITAIGCQDPNAGAGDQDQDAQSAADRIQELEDYLAQAERERAADQERILALRSELDRLKNENAGKREPTGWTSVPGGAMTSIEGTVLFDSGKAKLKSSAKTTLGQISQIISQQYPGRDIYIFGHTDSKPIRVSGWKDNEELSCQRSLSVLRHLRRSGVSQKMAACGWGQSRPITDNKTAQGRHSNRRVEIYAMKSIGDMAGAVSSTVR